MRTGQRLLGAALTFARSAELFGSSPRSADLAQHKITIGVVFDPTGPFAGDGPELHYIGANIVIDHFIKLGGVEG